MEFSKEPFAWQRLPDQMLREIAVREKALRKQHGLSQQVLAEKSGVSLGSLKRFELTGQISLESLLKIAFVLDCLEDFGQLFPPDNRPKSLDDLLQ